MIVKHFTLRKTYHVNESVFNRMVTALDLKKHLATELEQYQVENIKLFLNGQEITDAQPIAGYSTINMAIVPITCDVHH